VPSLAYPHPVHTGRSLPSIAVKPSAKRCDGYQLHREQLLDCVILNNVKDLPLSMPRALTNGETLTGEDSSLSLRLTRRNAKLTEVDQVALSRPALAIQG
jgi:hypothetical protein